LEETLHCNITDESVEWVIQIASGKTREKANMTTLQIPDGKITPDMIQTPTVTLEQLILQDNKQDDRDYHREIRSLAEQPIDTPEDKDFTQD
jgi:hypothetical protein